MAVFAIICNELNKLGITKEDYKEYFVFATDPDKSQLLEISKELGIPTLEIPSNVGGRFSVLSPVGLLPAVYTGIDIESLINGASEFCNKLSSECSSENELSLSAHLLEHLRSQGISQTVLMPYSSKLRSFSDWFVQLWAESLGKENCRDGKTVNTGLTPISSYGATDQHSQVQLFMEGPKDKFIAFVSIDNFQTDFELKNDFSQPSLTKLSTHSLAELMRAELIGTKEALDQKGRPYLELKLAQLDEASLGALIGFFECLTVLMGIKMNINPFDQPGVEAGKIFAFEWLGRKNK
jgi:glucose-6-phosphate isomerase